MINKFSFFLFIFLLPLFSQAQNCDTVVGSRTNLGIYGGNSLDIAFTKSGRLFSVGGDPLYEIASPKTAFTSDDTGHTWYASFPFDSLEYECGSRGWGGGAFRVLTNQKEWVAIRTKVMDGDLSTAVISFQNGDTGTWKTAIDWIILQSLGYDSCQVTNIGMTDYYLYVLLKKYIARIDTSSTDSTDILDISTKVSGFSSNNYLKSIAIANNDSGYPYYFVIDSLGSSPTNAKGKLYKNDGATISNIALPGGMSGVDRVFTHPGQVTADTLFITGKNSTGYAKVFRSLDGGISWSDITSSPANGAVALEDVDYSANWKSVMPSSNGLLLINELSHVSKDMGSSWMKSAAIPQSEGNIYANPLAMHPNDTSIFSGTSTPGIYLTKTGINGPLIQLEADGLEAVFVWKIDKNATNSIVYLATESGLAYTTKYNDTLINGPDKWQSPYGIFPIDSTDVIGGITAVAIDPYDSAHVISGWSGGFYVSKTGPLGFFSVTPNNYDIGAIITRDIAYVTSDIVIAVNGTKKNTYKGNGDIWRSSDGGLNWTNVSPSGFGTGTTVAVGYGVADTVIYAGSGLKDVESGYLWKSTDLGLTWNVVNTGPNDYTNSSITGLPINDIVVDPRGKDTIYIAAGYDDYRALVFSYDGGVTYNQLNIASSHYYSAIELDTTKPDSALYISNANDLFIYVPVLDTSILILTGLPHESIHDLNIGSILVGTTTGFYTVIFDNSDVDITSIAEPETTTESLIYPNPTNGKLIVSIQTNSNIQELQVYNMLGQIQCVPITPLTNNSFQLNTQSLENGMYLLKISNGNTYLKQKVMIAR